MRRIPRKIKKLEQRFLLRSGASFARAAQRVRRAGLTVVIAEQDMLYEVAPDGTRTAIKQVQPPIQVRRGLRVRLQ